jgi:cyclopropane-fatty-acyl-phospholipid synthase
VLPDFIVRLGIRRLLAKRLQSLTAPSWPQRHENKRRLIEHMGRSDVAVCTKEANGQHYELPPAFFEKALGRHLKYSCGYWPEGVSTLDGAEEAALKLVEQRARLADGQDILELGCGWGSLTLWMASRFPNAKITAVSNSAPQRHHIQRLAKKRGIHNVQVITQDINRFDTDSGSFDRVVSIEMFEHTRNWQRLFARVSRWLNKDGLMFLHVFTHRSEPYFFDTAHDNDWMGRMFFTGGMMPSDDLPYHFNDTLKVQDHWVLSGEHYAKTARAWLNNQDANPDTLLQLLEKTYGSKQASRLWWQRWRIFWMACEELWAYRNGNEWGVSHYLLKPSRETDNQQESSIEHNTPGKHIQRN